MALPFDYPDFCFFGAKTLAICFPRKDNRSFTFFVADGVLA